MNTEPNGGARDGSADPLQERLARRFDSELAQAERDYPSLSVASRARAEGAGRRSRGRWSWPRLASGVVAVGVLAVVGLIGVGLASKPAQVSGPSLSNPPRAATPFPSQIDGQKVYSVADKAQWEKLGGGFLLAAYAAFYPIPCPAQPPSQTSGPDTDLVASCPNMVLQATAGLIESNPVPADSALRVAPKSVDLSGWTGGPEIVMRVHSHDPEAAKCGADLKALCDGAIVVEAVVWPDIPAQFEGQKVYRAVDQASFPTSGSFLLGGRVSRPAFAPGCPIRSSTAAELQLMPSCLVVSIDGLAVAPKSVLDAPNNEIVVAKVHINDSQAAGCPASALDQCKSAVVVESVLWRSDVLVNASPTATGSPLLPNGSPGGVTVPSLSPGAIGTGEGVGSTSVPSSQPSAVTVGRDGVPVSFGGQAVYRASNLPADASFLLGGVLGRDATCAAPTGVSAKPPACGYWTVDGLAVGNMVSIPDSLIGSVVVVEIQRSKTVGVCAGGPCRTTEILVVTRIVWSGSAAVSFPPFPIALPS